MSIDHYSTAAQMITALRKRDVSAAELAELHIARIEAQDDRLNAIPVRTFERARAAAERADKRLDAGDRALLLGVPMTLKESTLTEGLPQTAGLEAFKGYLPDHDGPIAARVLGAGAGLLGKTNIPVALGDWQADSPVYGRTNNPWDLSRTPGGSTGGGAAALAAGMTPLEVGSDIGGSIRVPGAYCGVYGHRPSETAIPKSGSFPMADLPNPASLMGVQGPLARSAGDLELLFRVLSGPEAGEDVAWKLALPAPRHNKLGDFRVAVIGSVLDTHPSSEMTARLDELVRLLTKEGARVEVAQPELDMNAYFHDYSRLLNVIVSQGTPADERAKRAKDLRDSGDPVNMAQADGLDMDAGSFLMLVNRRETARLAWRKFFENYDVVIAPMALDAAFPHEDRIFHERTLTVDNTTLPYYFNILFPMLAIFPGLPSTAFPAGLNAQGLPLGLQAIGPYLEDLTTIRFAQLLEKAWYRFEAPPGY